MPQFAEPVDPATRQYNALRQQALQQEMMRNQLIMQNTMEDRRLAAATRAQNAAEAAKTRRQQEETLRVLQGGFTPARNPVMGPGTTQAPTPAGYDFQSVTNALLQRGNLGGVEAVSKMQQQLAAQQKAQAEVPGTQAESRKKGTEADKAEFTNAFDQMSVLAPYIASGAMPARAAVDVLLKHPVAGKLLSSAMTPEQMMDFAEKNPQGVAQILATPPDKIYESLVAKPAGRTETITDSGGNTLLLDKDTGVARPVTMAAPAGAVGEPVKSATKGGLTEAQRLREKRATGDDYNMATTALRDLQDVVRTADRLEKADLSSVTGYASKVPSFSAEATKAESDIDTLKGKMTALSKTLSSASGKLGNLAVAEYQMLRDQIAAFDPYKGEAATRQQLADIKSTMSRIENSVRDVYSRTYGGEDNPFTQFRELPKEVGANAKVSTGDAEIDSLLGKYGQ
jgi:hypothetical protein